MTPDQFRAEAAKAGAALSSPQQLQGLLRNAGIMMVADAKGNISGSHDPDGRPYRALAHPRPSGGNKPLQDRGLLGASFSAKQTASSVVVGTNRPGANLHQMGGTITPKRAKYLAIPLTRAAQRAGGPRKFPGLLHAVIGAKGGVMLDEKDVPQYALTKGPIRVPARPFVGFGQRLLAKLDRLFGDFLTRVLPGGK